MGNSSSKSPEKDVFQKELALLNTIVSNILSEKDVFKNEDYNFLSQDVCQHYQVILEEELHKHLKLSIKSLGASLYIIPKNDEEKLTKLNLTKRQVCAKISNHYVKILYILSLIKYVYNLEKHGDLSIAGIIFRNVRLLDDIMEINFCNMPHKNYAVQGKKQVKMDFSHLEGFKFFVEYFLDVKESVAFIGLMRTLLARHSKKQVQSIICEHVTKKGFSTTDFAELESLYQSKFGEKLVCQSHPKAIDNGFPTTVNKPNLSVFINKDNAIFAKDYCMAPRKMIVKTSTTEGKRVLEQYAMMKRHYDKNIATVKRILDRLVEYKGKVEGYTLRDIDKTSVDKIVQDTKQCIKVFYLQSLVDFQNLLDVAKQVPNIDGVSD